MKEFTKIKDMKINSKFYFLGLVIFVMILEPALDAHFHINIGDSPMYTVFVSAVSYFLNPKELDKTNNGDGNVI